MSQNDLVLPHIEGEEAEAPRPTQYHARHKRDTGTLREKQKGNGTLCISSYSTLTWSGRTTALKLLMVFVTSLFLFLLSKWSVRLFCPAPIYFVLSTTLNLQKKIDIVGSIEVQLHEVMQAT